MTPILTHTLIPTLAVAALGLLAARMGDLIRIPYLDRKRCEEARQHTSVWAYNSAKQRPSGSAWQPVHRNNGSC